VVATPTPTPVPTPPLGTPPSAVPEATPVPSGEVALAPGGSLRVSDSGASQGLLESIAAGIAGLFFGN
jgi:hypothetical protein